MPEIAFRMPQSAWRGLKEGWPLQVHARRCGHAGIDQLEIFIEGDRIPLSPRSILVQK